MNDNDVVLKKVANCQHCHYSIGMYEEAEKGRYGFWAHLKTGRIQCDPETVAEPEPEKVSQST